MSTTVIATRRGYYGDKIRDEGERFEINDPKHFSEYWMEKVTKRSASKKAASEAVSEESGATSEEPEL